MKLTLESKIKDLYASPIGHDALYKVLLQLNLRESVITNPVVSNLKLSTLVKLAKGKVPVTFFEALINLVNIEKDVPQVRHGNITKQWWKEAVFYQIYPRSFYDSNNDGIGDIRGIIEKLDYLKDLGIDALWLSPIYDSPLDDNGYDIRDYYKILSDFGTMEDFDELLEKVHQKGMKLIMDLVVNHTSDEHEWFKKALKDKNSKYHDYYHFKDQPNNWTSFFAGSAWNYYEENDEYALHLFSKKQMDLNWENEEVRKDVISMINWWLDKGVDGFRLDVINYISKPVGLPDGEPFIGNLMGYVGIETYYYGEHLHDYLREINEKAFAPHNAFSVGETPGLGMKMCQLITGEERKELDMVFSFDHLETPGHVRFEDYKYDLEYLKNYMIDWMENYGDQCWMSLFYNNHDNPRMISKITDNESLHHALSVLLAVIQFTLKGTPFVYQGDEMGLKNYPFESIDDIRDVESKGYYKQLLETKSEEETWKIILAGTREHTRILLPFNQYDESFKKEFIQSIDTDITNIYKELIALRKENEALIYGEFKVLDKKKGKFVYTRTLNNEEYLIDCNLTDKPIKAYKTSEHKIVFPHSLANENTLAPYEARIYKKI